MGATEIDIRPALEADVESITSLHEHAFPAQLTTLLGGRVVRDYYHRAFDGGASMQLVVAEIDDILVGFAAVLVRPDEFYSAYRRRRLRVAALALPALLRHPGAVGRVLGAYGRGKESSLATDDGVKELASIAVSTDCRGLGVGRALVKHALSDLTAPEGCLYLWTDAVDNEGTLAFYAKLGFHEDRQHSFDGRRKMARLTHFAQDAKSRDAS